ncbi:subtilase-type protease inhibitor [Streptomyces sp. RS10V-4]|uniref:SSI family serine proteinase inhibitor n=1 Tax=Streptomyces rhizoryzae TaxID=2932493 RepID=UPI00200364F9|nr:SSI family serine proteinase inhibitor [Streptomyces rhizoryzae]MCK7627517.1 subtilase-type protease inhibitor [Streptomyces rhizoryzae]
MFRRRTPFPFPHRSLALVAAAAATAAVALAGVPAATAAPLPLPSRHAPGEAGGAFGAGRGDHLTITVTESGSARTDGRFELYCHPRGGNHFDVRRACDRLDRMARWGKDPFAPVPRGAQCTMMYGGPARARVTGVWAGRPVNAEFRRTNGCEIARWGRFEPMLPATVS